MTIYSLPRSLIETASSILYKKRIPYGFLSFKDFWDDEQDIRESAKLPPMSDWQIGKSENTRDSLNHLYEFTHTDDDKTHVYRYTAASTPLNKMLMAAHKENTPVPDTFEVKRFTHDIHGLDAAIHRNKLKHELISYTGVGWHPLARTNDNNELYLPAYTSTSTNKSIATHFGVNHAEKKNSDIIHVIKIHHPIGSPGIHTHDDPAITHYPHESEYLMPRGTTIKINPTPEIFSHEEGRHVHIWTAHRIHTDDIKDINHVTQPQREEIFNNDKMKIYKTHTLSALNKHYPKFYDQGAGAEEFHATHAKGPVYHLHMKDGNILQSSRSVYGTPEFIDYRYGRRHSYNDVASKYPEINEMTHLFNHGEDESR